MICDVAPIFVDRNEIACEPNTPHAACKVEEEEEEEEEVFITKR